MSLEKAVGYIVTSGTSILINAAGGLLNVMARMSMPFTQSENYYAPIMYNDVSPIGVAAFADLPVGTEMRVVTWDSATPPEPTGASCFLKTGSTAADWVEFGSLVASDPGDAAAIPVTGGEMHYALTSAGAETRTLAIPNALGQKISLWCDTYVGNIVVTAASAINVANNTTMTFSAVSQFITLQSVSAGGTLAWQVVGNDGVTLG